MLFSLLCSKALQYVSFPTVMLAKAFKIVPVMLMVSDCVCLYLCISTAIGQIFIFYTVKSFGAVIFAIIMSVRILCSTVLSCLVYSHSITEIGYVGILMVFGAVWQLNPLEGEPRR